MFRQTENELGHINRWLTDVVDTPGETHTLRDSLRRRFLLIQQPSGDPRAVAYRIDLAERRFVRAYGVGYIVA